MSSSKRSPSRFCAFLAILRPEAEPRSAEKSGSKDPARETVAPAANWSAWRPRHVDEKLFILSLAVVGELSGLPLAPHYEKLRRTTRIFQVRQASTNRSRTKRPTTDFAVSFDSLVKRLATDLLAATRREDRRQPQQPHVGVQPKTGHLIRRLRTLEHAVQWQLQLATGQGRSSAEI